MKPTLAIVIPTFSQFPYARLAVASALKQTRLATVRIFVADDASPDARKELPGLETAANALAERCGHPEIQVHWFPENGGLTRSWNQGLLWAKRHKLTYTCVTNSDVKFSPGWDVPLLKALDTYDLVGPITNAPGTEQLQYARTYTKAYSCGDRDETLCDIAIDLRKHHANAVIPGTLNGFCMVAKTATWWAGAFDEFHVFNPHNAYNSQGKPNPTPLMTLNEYELQRRWHAKGFKTGFVPSSYVFHYRAVSRGDAHKKGDWLRIPEVTAQ